MRFSILAKSCLRYRVMGILSLKLEHWMTRSNRENGKNIRLEKRSLGQPESHKIFSIEKTQFQHRKH